MVWRRRGDDVETTWGRRGDDVETTWRRRGDDMETTWRRHGDGIIEHGEKESYCAHADVLYSMDDGPVLQSSRKRLNDASIL